MRGVCIYATVLLLLLLSSSSCVCVRACVRACACIGFELLGAHPCWFTLITSEQRETVGTKLQALVNDILPLEKVPENGARSVGRHVT